MKNNNPENPNTKNGPASNLKPERIAKRIAHLGYCSRAEAERLILEHKVKVNDTYILTPAFLVTHSDKISINGEILTKKHDSVLYAYYKPTGLICSTNDEKGRATIFDDIYDPRRNLPKKLPRLMYIGRLDFNSEGLLLLTNDSTLATKLSSNTLGLKRKYKVRAFGKTNQNSLDKLALGIEIKGIYYKSVIANIISKNKANIWLEFILTEGKNKEIRNICEYLGLSVNRLIRTDFGSYSLGNMQEGDLREIPFLT